MNAVVLFINHRLFVDVLFVHFRGPVRLGTVTLESLSLFPNCFVEFLIPSILIFRPCWRACERSSEFTKHMLYPPITDYNDIVVQGDMARAQIKAVSAFRCNADSVLALKPVGARRLGSGLCPELAWSVI